MTKPINEALFKSLRRKVLSDNDMPDHMFGWIHFGYFKSGGMVQDYYVESRDPFLDSEIRHMIDYDQSSEAEILAFKLGRSIGEAINPDDLDVRSFRIDLWGTRNLELLGMDLRIDGGKPYRPDHFPTHEDLQRETDLSNNDFAIFCDALHELIIGEFNAYRTFNVWVHAPSIDKMVYLQLSYCGFQDNEFSDHHSEKTDEGYSAESVYVELQSFNGNGWVEITNTSDGRDCDGSHGQTTSYILKLDELDQPYWDKQIHRCRHCHEPLDVPSYECGRHEYYQR